MVRGKKSDKSVVKKCSFCDIDENSSSSPLVEGENGIFICECCTEKAHQAYTNLRLQIKNTSNSDSYVIPTPKQIVEHLDSYIVGQENAKRTLAIAVVNHYKRLNDIYNKEIDVTNPDPFQDVELEKSNILLLGPTGCGKTLLAQTMAKFLNVPFAIGDATTLTEAGYVGEDVENLLLKLITAANGDIKKAERGIIYVDEIDKIGKSGGNVSITRDVSGEGVQQALLKMLEGTIASVPPTGGRKHPEQNYLTINTSNILFICGGTFVGIEEIILKRLGKKQIGFGAKQTFSSDLTDKEKETILEYATTDDVVEFGLIPEFVGRLPVITNCNPLSEEVLAKILTEPKNALLKQFAKIFNMDGVKLEFEKEAILEIARIAKQKNTGARGLRGVVENVISPLLFDLPEKKKGSKVKITKKFVTDATLKNSKAA